MPIAQPVRSEHAGNVRLCPLGDLAALAGEALQRGKRVRLRVRGWSMQPAIRDGEVVWLVPVRAAQVGRGDIVLYLGGDGRPVIHRVLRREGATELRFCIGADGMPREAEWVAAAALRARVVAVERAGRSISLAGWRGRLWAWFFLALRPFRPLLRSLCPQPPSQGAVL